MNNSLVEHDNVYLCMERSPPLETFPDGAHPVGYFISISFRMHQGGHPRTQYNNMSRMPFVCGYFLAALVEHVV